MTAITVRNRITRELIAFGPGIGLYDPWHNPAVAVKALEPNYDTVLAEWTAQTQVPSAREVAKQRLKEAASMPELIAILGQLL